ncbi:phosphohistidine phosphatase SixA [Vibrio astriarenae]|uniref:phosphohistidine phosphatase SixA n=1 Tax=Vibrio astriarenae TaxID=1481923 RepID=UPI003736D883
MKVIIMRHGEAEMFASSDAERQLTPNGVDKNLAAADQLVAQGIVNIDKVLVSPYVRAQQTWDNIGHKFDARSIETFDDITPYGDADDVFEYVCALADAEALDSVMLVSHLPLVSYMTSVFASNTTPPMFVTSGVAVVDFDLTKRSGEISYQS